MAERILVVDDDRQLTSFLERFLCKQGYQVDSAAGAIQMGKLMEHRECDLLVLDIGLPDGDGFEITREIRRHSHLPIVVLTARDEVFDRVIGLELGADDYVTKPFEPRELLARIKSVLRRSHLNDASPNAVDPDDRSATRHFDNFQIDLVRRIVSRKSDGATLSLTSTEYALLLALTARPGQIMDRSAILAALYGNSTTVTDRSIDAHIARLRRKLGDREREAPLIQTVHGVGYLLGTTVTEE